MGQYFHHNRQVCEVSHTSGPATVDTHVMSLGQEGDELA